MANPQLWPSTAPAPPRYHSRMTNKPDHTPLPPELERYLALCERAFERMVETGKWPWLDSPNFDDVVESKDNSTNV